MGSKLKIEGKLIGTTAESVDYRKDAWTGIENVKAALNDLHARLTQLEENGGGGNSHVTPFSGLVGKLQTFGDSISTDRHGENESRLYACYARLMSKWWGAALDLHAVGGADLRMLNGYIDASDSDADVVTVMFGENDSRQIILGYGPGESVPLTAGDGYYYYSVENFFVANHLSNYGVRVYNNAADAPVFLDKVSIMHNGAETVVWNGGTPIEIPVGWSLLIDNITRDKETFPTYKVKYLIADFSTGGGIQTGDEVRVYYSYNGTATSGLLSVNANSAIGNVEDAFDPRIEDPMTFRGLTMTYWGKYRRCMHKLYNRSVKKDKVKVFCISVFGVDNAAQNAIRAGMTSFTTSMNTAVGKTTFYPVAGLRMLAHNAEHYGNGYSIADASHPHQSGHLTFAMNLFNWINCVLGYYD